MSLDPKHRYSAFAGVRLIASGSLADVAVAAAKAAGAGKDSVLVFSDSTGEQADLDLRGQPEAIAARYRGTEDGARGRGRPKLGVVAREVTLLPDQWEWLASQPGGASVALRKLVQAARGAGTARERMRRSQERSYKFMVALAGNLPGFEEAARALFANDEERLRDKTSGWPQDVRDHVLRLSDPDGHAPHTA
jgi:uncharacterized protein